jgi:hypothetical protein
MLVFAASRWPGMLPQNFSAAHALLFCAAFWLPGWMGWVLPLATIIVTDILLNLFHYNMPVMVPELVVNWMILALFVVLAKWLARRRSYGRVFLGTLMLGDETRPLAYGRDQSRDLAGFVDRVGERQWRLALPLPAFESLVDVIELVPAAS